MAHVLVTGGSGFIASCCTLHLLEAGHTTRVTVRNPARGTALREHLHAVADFDDSRLWDFIATEGNGLELSAVNPTTVIGPLVGPDDPPTLRMIRGMLDGAMPACPPFATGWVDVRDVADLHVRAMTAPAAAGERFLAIAGHSRRIVDISGILRDRLGARAAKAPTRELPLFLARALGVTNPQLRALRPQLGQNFNATSAKAEPLLGWRPRPLADTVADTAESLLANPITGR